jgi:hypothetical protein
VACHTVNRDPDNRKPRRVSWFVALLKRRPIYLARRRDLVIEEEIF